MKISMLEIVLDRNCYKWDNKSFMTMDTMSECQFIYQKRIIPMKRFLTVCMLSMCYLFSFSQGEIIQWKTFHKRAVKLSEIGTNPFQVKLQTNGKTELFRIHQVILTDQSIMVTEGPEKNKGFPYRVLKFSKKGEYIKELFNPGKIVKVAYDKARNHIFIQHGNSISLINEKGELIEEFKTENGFSQLAIYNGYLWGIKLDLKQDVSYYSLIRLDRNGRNRKVIKRLKETEDILPRMGRHGSLSIHGNQLVVSMGCNHFNHLFQVEGDKLKPFITMENKSVRFSARDKLFATNGFVSGNYLFWDYSRNFRTYTLLLDISEREVIGITANKKPESAKYGLIDDLFNTGTVKVRNTAQCNHLFFYHAPKMPVNSLSLYFFKTK
ncbi:hypothetical protein EMN47_19945 [Prolixibacteraceae bacterium JC049]|nr:hypothetical protein [Prolixibacteraceae bacterium JC049]